VDVRQPFHKLYSQVTIYRSAHYICFHLFTLGSYNKACLREYKQIMNLDSSLWLSQSLQSLHSYLNLEKCFQALNLDARFFDFNHFDLKFKYSEERIDVNVYDTNKVRV